MSLQNPLRAAQSFIFGGNTGLTYEQMKAAREFAARQQQALARTPTNVGEGWGAILRGLAAGRSGRSAEAAATEGRERVQSALGTLLQGRLGGGAPTAPAMSFLPPQGAAEAQQPALGNNGGIIRQGLVQRGLPEHVADAFVMNFQDESGLNPGINEEKPLVPGSRGGFGLAQWTGPRRKQLEAFAAQQGKPVSDPNVQMDFLMTELQGPERSAAQAILSAPDARSAAAAVVNKFLRPAEVHRAEREAKYLGGQAPQSMALSEGQQPDLSFVSQMGGQGIDPQLMAVMADPYVSELPQMQQGALAALFQQQMAQAYPEQMTPYQQAQIELERQKLALDMQPQPVKPIEVNGQLVDPTTGQVLGDYRDEAGAGGTEYGLTPQYGVDEQGNPVLVQIGKDGTAVQTQMPEGVTFQKEPIRIDAGTHYVLLDPISRQPVGQVPKNLAEAAAQEAAGAAQGKATAEAQAGLSGAIAKADQAIGLLSEIRNDPALPGITGMFQGRVPPMSQAGVDLNTKIEQAKGQVFLEAFQSLKGGGAITELEGKKAEQAIARMDRAQSLGAYQAALDELVGVIEAGKQRAMQKAGGMVPPRADPTAPSAPPAALDNDPLGLF